MLGRPKKYLNEWDCPMCEEIDEDRLFWNNYYICFNCARTIYRKTEASRGRSLRERKGRKRIQRTTEREKVRITKEMGRVKGT